MAGEVKIDTVGFERALLAWQRGARVDIREAVRTQAIALLRQLLRLLPPKSLAQGRRALARDLRRAVQPVFYNVESQAIEEMVEAGDLEALGVVMRRSNGLRSLELVPFGEDLHRAARDARTGKVEQKTYKATIDHQEWREYLRRVSARVGMAKGSLAGTLLRLGEGVPGWMARHADKGATVDTTGNRTKPNIRIISLTGYLRQLGIDRLLAFVIRSRTGSMERDLKRILKERASGAGFRAR